MKEELVKKFEELVNDQVLDFINSGGVWLNSHYVIWCMQGAARDGLSEFLKSNTGEYKLSSVANAFVPVIAELVETFLA